MKRSTWVLRCTATAIFLLATNSMIALHLIRAFTIQRIGLFLFCYAAVLLLLVICFRCIRSAVPYAIRCIGAYGMGLYIAVSMVTAVFFFLPVPAWVTPLAALLLAAYGFLQARKIYVNQYDVPILDSPFRVVLISDIHLGAVGSEERLPRLVNCINAQKPDLVCIAGDLIDNCFDAVRDPDRAATLLRSLESRCGVYACLGNHDAGESAEAMQRFMKDAGITVLAETYETVDGIQLLGRLDARPHGNYVNQVRGDTETLLSENPRPELPLITIDHNPVTISQYDRRCTLLLCGHTHNGQIFPGNLVIRTINICSYGYYRKDKRSPHVIVSSGAGAWGPPMRIGTNCEIAVINLGA